MRSIEVNRIVITSLLCALVLSIALYAFQTSAFAGVTLEGVLLFISFTASIVILAALYISIRRLKRLNRVLLSVITVFVLHVVVAILFVMASIFTSGIPYSFFKQTFFTFWLKGIKRYGLAILYFSGPASSALNMANNNQLS